MLVIVPDGQVSHFRDDSSIEATRVFLNECFGLSFWGESAAATQSQTEPEEMELDEAAVSEAGEQRESLRTGVTQVQCTLVKLRSKIMEVVLLMDHLCQLKSEQLKIIEETDPESHASLSKELQDSYRPALARLGAQLEKLYNVACQRKTVYGIVEELVEKGSTTQLVKSAEKVQNLLNEMKVVPTVVNTDLREALGELDANLADIELQLPKPAEGPEVKLPPLRTDLELVPESDMSLLPMKNQPLDIIKQPICRLSRAGDNPGQFNFPVHATFLPDGGFMVCDKKNDRLQIFDKTGKFNRLFLNKQIRPRRARLNPHDGLIYISNEHTESVKAYTMNGEYIKSIGEKYFTCPSGLDFDSKGNIVMSDAEKATLTIHTPDNHRLNKFAFAHFYPNVPCPYFVACNSEDSIIASDYRNNMVKAFTSSGRELFCIEDLNCPRGICVDKDDNILIAEGDAHRVSLYSPYGKFLQYVLTEDDGLQYPMSVEIDQNQRVLVTQFGIHSSEVMMYHLSYDTADAKPSKLKGCSQEDDDF